MVHYDEVNSLKGLPMAKLRQIWRKRIGQTGHRKDPPLIRSLLIRELAWQAQKGGLDAQTQALLKAAIGQVNLRKSGPKKPRSDARFVSRIRPRTKPRLQSGTKLIRKWRGKKYEVLVVDGGKRFQFQDKVYRSLTPIAKEITGAHWSGPRFFGLNRVRAGR